MTVYWTLRADEARVEYWVGCVEATNEDTADAQDLRIYDKGQTLDGVMTHRKGVQPGTYLAPACSGKFTLIYRRFPNGDAEILDVVPSRSNWESP